MQSCPSAVDAQAGTLSPMPDTCPKCSQPIEAGDVKCPVCGEPMPEPVVAPANKAVVIFAALMPVLALIVIGGSIGGVAAFLYRHHAATPTPIAIQAPLSQASAPVPPPITPVPTLAPPVVSPSVVTPTAPLVPTPPPLPRAAVTPPAVPAIPLKPAAPAIDYPAPLLTDLDPPITGPGTTLKLTGENLSLVNKVLLINSHGATFVKANIVSKEDKQLQIRIPDVPFADYGIVIAAFSPGGVAILADQHTLSAESYSPDSHPHDSVVSVHQGDEIFAGDHMVIIARPGADVSLGNDCVAFLNSDVRLKAVGKRCHIYFVPPAPLEAGVSRDGFVEIKALTPNFDSDAFRVKPAPPGQDQ
jgi:hypothetical protein